MERCESHIRKALLIGVIMFSVGAPLCALSATSPRSVIQLDTNYHQHPSTQETVRLWNAVIAGDLPNVQDLVSPYNVNTYVYDRSPRNHSSLLHMACDRGHNRIILELLDKGADVNILNERQERPIHSAVSAIHQNPHIVGTLISYNADIDPPDMHGITPLMRHTCISYEQADPLIPDLLVWMGARTQACTNNQYSVLHYAAREGRIDMIHIIIRYYRNIHVQNKDHATPAQLAKKRHNWQAMNTVWAYDYRYTQKVAAEADAATKDAHERVADPAYEKGNQCLHRLSGTQPSCTLCKASLAPWKHHRLTCSHGVCHTCWKHFKNWCTHHRYGSSPSNELHRAYLCPICNTKTGVSNVTYQAELFRALRDLGQGYIQRGYDFIHSSHTDENTRQALIWHAHHLGLLDTFGETPFLTKQDMSLTQLYHHHKTIQ